MLFIPDPYGNSHLGEGARVAVTTDNVRLESRVVGGVGVTTMDVKPRITQECGSQGEELGGGGDCFAQSWAVGSEWLVAC